MNDNLKDVQSEVENYLKRYPDATPEEIAALLEWIQEGNSPYENGDGVCDDNCRPLDYIGTLRFWDGMYQEWLEDPEGFLRRYCTVSASDPINPKEAIRPDDNE